MFGKHKWPTEQEMLHDRDPSVREFSRKAIDLKQELMETGADEKTIFREMKKLKDEFYKELIKKHPEEKANIQRLRKNLTEFTNIKLRFIELLDISKRRRLNNKETRELENINKKLKQLKF